MNRTDIPEIRRPREGRLQVAIPLHPGGNRPLIMSACGPRSRPGWDRRRGCWLVPRSRFTALIEVLAARYGRVRVITVHREAERCDLRCQQARATGRTEWRRAGARAGAWGTWSGQAPAW